MLIECEMCGTQWIVDKPPLNNICTECCHVGSLFICKEFSEGKVWRREDFE